MKVYAVITRNEKKEIVGVPYCVYATLEDAKKHAAGLEKTYSTTELAKGWTTEIVELPIIY